MRFIILILLLNSNTASGQNIAGFVIDEKSKSPVEYVNIGIKGKNIGTVSDFKGKYNLSIDSKFDNDTLLFSCIGYAPFSIKITDLKKYSDKNIFLKEKIYDLNEVVVKPKLFKQRTLGVTTSSKMINAGFQDNLLGYECGILMSVKKSALIKRVNINISDCSYDTVFCRLNIYKMQGEMEFENILTKPIYINLSKDEVKDQVVVDLQQWNIVVDGDFLVTLEYVKDLGPGYLYFCAGLSNKTYARKTSQGIWKTFPAGISISVAADMEK